MEQLGIITFGLKQSLLLTYLSDDAISIFVPLKLLQMYCKNKTEVMGDG